MSITANDLRKIADAMDAAAATFSKPHHHATKVNGGIPDEIKKKLISCVHPDHCSSIHANSVSQWLLAQ